ncbi:MAG: aspartate--tRNA ligase [Verrucomicrobia bacterium]|nr:aspartate--tRNA ligase [Verrucomicrobiota bacterium]
MMKRSHSCGALRAGDAGKDVQLAGWVSGRRDHGGVIFIDLRDREGITQVVFNPALQPKVAETAHTLRSEFVVAVTGKVTPRPEGTKNPALGTGEIEVTATGLTILNPSETPPFPLDEEGVNEDLRLRYRYLDLRRPAMAEALRARHRAALAIRRYLDQQGFLEIETPVLFKSTPEGAREYLVPSRLNPGKFYALPQSPQQFKQLLMVAGAEKYFQIARCFRDEDLRADRQPEFTQIDLEMSFITREDIYAVIEGLVRAVWKEVRGVEVKTPFPRVTFADAMNQYGTDKPDRRYGLTLADFTDTFRSSAFKVFQGAVAAGGVVKAFNAKGLAEITTGQIEELTNLAKAHGAKGLAWIKVEGGEWKSPIVKFFSEAEKKALTDQLGIAEGDLILFGADQWTAACEVLGLVRTRCAEYLEKLGKLKRDPAVLDFHWVVDFPLLRRDPEHPNLVASHHPFTAPVEEDVDLLGREPQKVRGQHYDLVLNGVELGGGSIRIHQGEVQDKLFREILKLPGDVVTSRFGYMVEALKFGAPPHGGIALGFDRLMALLLGHDSIRDVIAFPKNARGQDVMSGAPAEATSKQLREVHIKAEGLAGA